MEKQTRKPNHLLRKVSLLLGGIVTLLLLPFAFGLLMGWFKLSEPLAVLAAQLIEDGSFALLAFLFPGIGEIADSVLAGLLATYGFDGLVLF